MSPEEWLASQPKQKIQSPEEWLASQPKQKAEPRLVDRFLSKLKDVSKGAIETPYALASGSGGMAAGGAAQIVVSAYDAAKELLGGDVVPGAAHNVGREVADRFTYKPSSDTAKNLVNSVSNIVSGFGLLPAAAEKIRETERGLTGGRTYASDIALGAASLRPNLAIRGAGTAGHVLSDASGLTELARKKQNEAAIHESQNKITDDLNSKAREMGFSLSPSATGAGIIPRSIEGLSGQAKFKQYATAKSQPIINDLARQEFSLPTEIALEPKVFSDISRDAYNRGYDPLKSYKEIKTDSEYAKEINGIGSHIEAAEESFGNSKDAASSTAQIRAIADGVRTNSFSGAAAISKIKLLREAADEAFAKQEPSVARANRAAANAIENQLERHLESLGENGVSQLKDYRDARTTIAKAHTYQKALVGSDINPQSIARDYKKNKGKFSGNLEFIGKLASEHPDIIKMSAGGQLTPVSVVDLMYGGLAGGGALATGGASAGVGLALAGLPIARVAGRHALLSDAVQKSLRPDYSTPLADIVAGKREVPYIEDTRPSDVQMKIAAGLSEKEQLARMFAAEKAKAAERADYQAKIDADFERNVSGSEAARLDRLEQDRIAQKRAAEAAYSQVEAGRARGESMVSNAKAVRMNLAKRAAEDDKLRAAEHAAYLDEIHNSRPEYPDYVDNRGIPQMPEPVNLTREIRNRGGLAMSELRDVLGEKSTNKSGTQVGVFTKNGQELQDMAEQLVAEHVLPPSILEGNGGARNLAEAIQRHLSGEVDVNQAMLEKYYGEPDVLPGAKIEGRPITINEALGMRDKSLPTRKPKPINSLSAMLGVKDK